MQKAKDWFAQVGPRTSLLHMQQWPHIARYCDTIAAMPHIARYLFQGGLVGPPNVAIPPPPWYLVSHRHICVIPHFATDRAITVRHPTKTIATKEFCDTIAASIARYEKYRYWASKLAHVQQCLAVRCLLQLLMALFSGLQLLIMDHPQHATRKWRTSHNVALGLRLTPPPALQSLETPFPESNNNNHL